MLKIIFRMNFAKYHKNYFYFESKNFEVLFK